MIRRRVDIGGNLQVLESAHLKKGYSVCAVQVTANEDHKNGEPGDTTELPMACSHEQAGAGGYYPAMNVSPRYKKCRGTPPGSWKPPLARRRYLYTTSPVDFTKDASGTILFTLYTYGCFSASITAFERSAA